VLSTNGEKDEPREGPGEWKFNLAIGRKKKLGVRKAGRGPGRKRHGQTGEARIVGGEENETRSLESLKKKEYHPSDKGPVMEA